MTLLFSFFTFLVPYLEITQTQSIFAYILHVFEYIHIYLCALSFTPKNAVSSDQPGINANTVPAYQDKAAPVNTYQQSTRQTAIFIRQYTKSIAFSLNKVIH